MWLAPGLVFLPLRGDTFAGMDGEEGQGSMPAGGRLTSGLAVTDLS